MNTKSLYRPAEKPTVGPLNIKIGMGALEVQYCDKGLTLNQ